MRLSIHIIARAGLVLFAVAALLGTPSDAGAQAKPSITTQPQSQSVLPGANASFTVVASGQQPMSYQWGFNSGTISDGLHFAGTTTATLTISNVTAGDAGNYFVVVSNSHGTVTSSNAQLQINSLPTISNIPDQRTFAHKSRLIFFLIGDAETPTANLTLTATSSNTNLVPATNIVFGGSGPNRTITVTPSQNYYSGNSTITVTVRDAAGAAASDTFAFTVADFADSGILLRGLKSGSVAWGDYDNDGDLDILQTGKDSNNIPVTVIYQNNGGSFSNIQAGLQALYGGEAQWGDYDNDGDLDVLLSGYTTNGGPVRRIYRNDGGNVFTPLPPLLDRSDSGPVEKDLSVAWGDYDNDGDLDALFTGYFPAIYRNDGAAGFTNISGFSWPPYDYSVAAWADADNDGNLDFIVMGVDTLTNAMRLYRNDGLGGFSVVETGLPSVAKGGIAWGDYDGDGYPDLVFTGADTNSLLSVAGVYRNLSGYVFSNAFVPPSYAADKFGSVAWGDFDNDGRPDFALVSGNGTSIFRNLGGSDFEDVGAVGGSYSYIAAGDADNDGDLDLLLMAWGSSGYFTTVLRNDGAMPDTPPTSPSNLSASIVGRSVAFSWSAAMDADQTAPLSYNLRLGTTPGGGNVVGSMADPATGRRRLPAVGNAGYRLTRTIKNLNAGTYYWSVQAIDNAFAGGTFAAEQTFTLSAPSIISQPQSQSIVAGQSAAFFAAASGTGALNYQWYFNGAKLFDNGRISGSTRTNLLITNVQALDSGNYTLVASNLFGVVTSAVATLTGVFPPVITLQPTDSSVLITSSVTLNASAMGTPPLAYQWLFNGSPLADGPVVSGATSPNLTLTGVGTNDGGDYRLVASNAWGVVTSIVATVTVGLPPQITSQPQSLVRVAGETATFTVSAQGTLPLAYRWLRNGGNLNDGGRISGSTTSTLSISNCQTSDAANYNVLVTNWAGGIASTQVSLTIIVPPTFGTQPAGRSAVLGMPANLYTFVSGSTPISFQWQFNPATGGASFADVPGATNSSYSISAVAATNYGLYRLVASNLAGVVISVEAPLVPGQIVPWGNNNYRQLDIPSSATNVVMVSAGSVAAAAYPYDAHSLALHADGTVVAWGGNGSGLIVPGGLSNVVAIAAGGYHSLALRADGTVVGWGNNTYGQSTPPATLSNVIAIAAGATHSLALRSDGKIVVWGLTNQNMLAVPTNLKSAVAIAAGVGHSLALLSDGTVADWGDNFTSPFVSPSTGDPTVVPAGLDDVALIAAGDSHDIVLRSNGMLVAWGSTNYSRVSIPAKATNAIALVTSDYYSAALLPNGNVSAWGGLNNFGPTNVPGPASNAIALSGSSVHVLALISDGRPVITRQPVGGTGWMGRDFMFNAKVVGNAPLALQWQFNGTNIPAATNTTLVLNDLDLTNAGSYQLLVSNALGSAASLPVPLTVLSNSTLKFYNPFITPFGNPGTNFVGGRLSLNAAVSGSGPVRWQWRFNGVDIFGATNEDLVIEPLVLNNDGPYSVVVSNSSMAITSSPTYQIVSLVRTWGGYRPATPPREITNAVAVAAGNGGSIYPSYYWSLRSDGKLAGWGESQSYPPENIQPASVSNAVVTAIAMGFNHSLALRSDGTVVDWGYAYYGNTNIPASATNITAIACGDYQDIALRSDGIPLVWGGNNPAITNVPASASSIVAVAAGGQHCLALHADGTVVAWGNNNSGQAAPPANLSNVVAIASGSGSQISYALKADGTVTNWGNNSPALTPTWTNIVAISAGGQHVTGLRSDGVVLTAGSYFYPSGSTAAVPQGTENVIAIASGGDHDVALFGTRVPAITIQPYDRRIFRGSRTLFVCKAVSPARASYQWFFNSNPIPGATNDIFTLTNAQFADSGSYLFTVSNRYGMVTSRVANLVVTLSIDEAVETTNLNWSASSFTPWFGQTNVSHDGVDAARSGIISDGSETILTLQTNMFNLGAALQIAFWWKVSSEAGFDPLEFRLNGAVLASISGEVDWERRVFTLTNGLNVLQWRYSKNVSGFGGQDAAWLDQVSFVPNPPVIVTQPTSKTVNVGSNFVSFYVGATGGGLGGPLGYHWWQNVTNPVGGNSSTLTLSTVSRAQRGSYFCIVTNAGGSAISSNATLNVLAPQHLGTPVVSPGGEILLTSRYFDLYWISPSDVTNFTAQVSDTLTNWMPLLGALNLTNGVLYFSDPDATNHMFRFYRIIEQ